MKNIFLLLLILILVPALGSAQGGVLRKLKDKVKERVDQRTEEGMDKGLDKAEDKVKGKGKAKGDDTEDEPKTEPVAKTSTAKADTAPASQGLKSYSRYDFVPGDQIVYAEDFEQDVIGEFPLKWFTNNRGETVTIEGQSNKWMRMYHGSRFVSPALKKLPDNFTLEFDAIIHFNLKEEEKGYVNPTLNFHLLDLRPTDANGRSYMQNQDALADAQFKVYPGEVGESQLEFQSEEKGAIYLNGSQKAVPKLDSYNGKVFHVAIWVQKERIRCWINSEKIYDLPKGIPASAKFNRLSFDINTSVINEEKIGMYVTNIKVAQGAPDMRSKLITEGKLVTSGILFDVNSDKIKPESYGVIKEIASVLTENSTVKVKVVGHTDSDGDAAKNLDLSKRRAASVKAMLASEFKIDASRMETDGLGETKPVADNATKEGKLQNRRVEFIKQ
ncbi:OmpA family protein [Flavisolibacter tropicus]|uniref:OmpA family protein n=1 Tax=Flavisolibacter tropicus TaxID=1492898 RepID=UPI000832A84A|nr:OmpA family protein [Flavisolibacter tropicus]